MKRVLNIISHSEAETEALAKKLSAGFTPKDVILLLGKLGSGKTVFVRGLAAGLGLESDMVSSPSFTIVNEYKGKNDLYHFDLYRIGEPEELYEIGWEDYLKRNGLVVVEWGKRAAEFLPPNYYQIEFIIRNEQEREINISLIHS